MALRGHFRRQLGSSPAAYRAAYRARRPQSERPTADLDSAPGPTPTLHPEPGPVPLQTRRTPAATTVGQALAAAAADNGRETYVTRATLPGQRSGT